jgi:hypothetical protein
MTKSENRETSKLLNFHDACVRNRMMDDNAVAFLARGFSALHRAAMTKKSKSDIMHAAHLVHCAWHKEFII